MRFKLLILLILSCCGILVKAQDPPVDPCEGLTGVFVNDPATCAGYFFCVNGQNIPGQCQPGFFFNEAEQLCDFEVNVPCVDCPPTGIEFVRVPGSCTQFVLCFNGVSSEQECPEGLYFDTSIDSCQVRAEVDCPYALCPATDPPNLIIFPSDEDCTQYYICSMGEALQQTCADGLHFDPINERCDLPELANCDADGGPVDPGPPDGNGECPEDTNGEIILIPHPTSCTHYFVCLDGVFAMLECGPGLIFDSVELECNTPDIAVCGDGPPDPEPTDPPE